MSIVKQDNAEKEKIGKGRERYLTHTDTLMMVVIDLSDGPTQEPDPPHSHPHEQVSYVAAGRIMVHIGNTEQELGPGDMFTVSPDVEHTIMLLTTHVRLIDCFTPLREDLLRP